MSVCIEKQSTSPDSRRKSSQIARFQSVTTSAAGTQSRWGRPRISRILHPESATFPSIFAQSQSIVNELQFISYPRGMWAFGALLLFAAIMYILVVHNDNVKAELQDLSATNQAEWKYGIGIGVCIAGILVMLSGRIESLYLTRDKVSDITNPQSDQTLVQLSGRLSWRVVKPTLYFGKKFKLTHNVERRLYEIKSVCVEVAGDMSRTNSKRYNGDPETDSSVYKLKFSFVDGTDLLILETREKEDAVMRCRLIRQFLSMQLESLKRSGSKESFTKSLPSCQVTPIPNEVASHDT